MDGQGEGATSWRMISIVAAEAELRKQIGINVRRRRMTQGLTLEEASKRAAMPCRKWQKIECGGVVNLTLTTLARIATVLKMTMPELMYEPSRDVS